MELAAAAADAVGLAVELDVAGLEHGGDQLGLARRSSARTRAISSGTENGLTT